MKILFGNLRLTLNFQSFSVTVKPQYVLKYDGGVGVAATGWSVISRDRQKMPFKLQQNVS